MSTADDLAPKRRAELNRRYGIDDIHNGRWSSDPGVDQILQVYETPHHRAPSSLEDVLAPAEPQTHPMWFTPPQRRPHVVQSRITELVHKGGSRMLSEDLRSYTIGFDLDLLHSSTLNRKPMPLKQQDDAKFYGDGMYSSSELREEFITRADLNHELRREALERWESFYLEHILPAACDSPNLVVIPHDSSGGEFGDCRVSERLPDGEPFVQTRVAFPVPVGWTPYRVARIALAPHADGCMWCGAVAKAGEGLPPRSWPIMLVSTRGALHTITTCHRCVMEIGPGPDYYEYDRADGLRGYPAERYR